MPETGDAERLVVLLEARIRDFEKNMQKADKVAAGSYASMRRGSKSATRQMEADMVRSGNRINQALALTSTKIGAFERSSATAFAGATRALGALGLVIGGGALIELTGQFTDLKSRVDNAAGSMDRGGAVMDRLSLIARRTYSSLSQTAESWLANSTSLKELGYSTQQQLDLTETLNNALVISATRGDKARSVMDAWSKAMAGGKLSGDNLNTVIQSGGRLAKALADSLGVTTGQLREMGAEGRITTDVMFGVTSQLQTLRDEADRMPATVSDGFTLLGNSVLRFVGEADKAIGSSSLLAEAIIDVADAIDRVRESEWFGALLKQLGDDLGKFVASTKRDIEGIGLALDYLQTHGARDVVSDMLGGEPAAVANGLRNVADAVTAIAGADAGAVFQELTEKLISNRISAEEAKKEILAFGEAHPNMAPTVEQFAALIDKLEEVRSGAVAAGAAVSAIPQGPSRGRGGPRAFKTRIDLDDDGGSPPPKPPGSPSKPRSGTSAKDIIADLQAEQAAIGATNLERRIMLELRRAGTSATAAEKEQITNLVTSIEQENASLATMQEQMETMTGLAKDFASTIVDGLMNGDSAVDAMGNAFKRLEQQLIEMAVNQLIMNLLASLFGVPAVGGGGSIGGGGSKGGLLGGAIIPGILHSGGEAGRDGYGHGKAYSAGLWANAGRYHNGGFPGLRPNEVPAILEKGEQVIPRGASGSIGGHIRVEVVTKVENGNLVPVMTKVAGEVSGQQIQQVTPAILNAAARQTPHVMNEFMARGDYR